MIRAAILTLALAACATDDTSPQPPTETPDIAAACCLCDGSARLCPPGAICTGWLATIKTDSSGGCSSYDGQAGILGMGSIDPHISYDSPGLHDCKSVPTPSGGCPDTFTPKQTATTQSSTQD